MPDIYLYTLIPTFALIVFFLFKKGDYISSFSTLILLEIPLIVWLTVAISQPTEISYDIKTPVFTKNRSQYIEYKGKPDYPSRKINVNIVFGRVFTDGDLVRVIRKNAKYAGIAFLYMIIEDDEYKIEDQKELYGKGL